MTDLDTFRAETRAWLEANAPPSLFGTRIGRFDGYWGGRNPGPVDPEVMRWFHTMLERGWTAPTWPQAYGGGGLSRDQGKILNEELQALKLPPPLVGFGLTMIGPTLLDYGTPEQQEIHLPAIVRGEVRWCQGYSEPGAGSDLASLQTRAIDQGDHFLVNGQKVWTSYADRSDWIFCLVRTDPNVKKQRGITFLLADMQSPGISTRPITLISGASPFCEVFFEDVQIPKANVVDEVNRGWTVAKALLGYERTMIGQAISGQLAGSQDSLVALARRHMDSPQGPLPNHHLRAQIARNAMNERAFMYTLQRIQQAVRDGRAPGPESSITKVYGASLKQDRWELAVSIAGEASLGWEGPGFDDEDLDNTRQWLRSRANSIEGGSSEIQLNIIAKRVLGLPSS